MRRSARINTMAMIMTTNEEWGKASGYPICCRKFYEVRANFGDKNPWFYPFVMRKYKSKWYQKYFGKLRHVTCPLHTLAVLLRLTKLRYFHCAECGWHQLGGKTCNIEHLHDNWRKTWIHEVIDRGYKYKIGGRIGERYRKEIGL